jgi:hypothetical protein
MQVPGARDPPRRAGCVVVRYPPQAAQCHGTPGRARKLAELAETENKRISPFVVGVSGHRDLHEDTLHNLRGAVADILTELKKRLPHSEVRLMSGMATGADLLAVQVALELGFCVDAILPMSLEHYAADFDAESFTLLQSLLAHPSVNSVELPLSPAAEEAAVAAGISQRDARYTVVTQTLTRGCSLLLALWDGKSSTLLPGGTADTVLRYLGARTDRNKSDAQVKILDALPEHELPVRFVYWIPTVRASDAPMPEADAPCFLAGLSDDALLRLPQMPRRLEIHLQSLNVYNQEYIDYLDHWRVRPAPDSLMRVVPGAAEGVAHVDQLALERIDAQYGKADALALHFQERSDRMFAFFNLVALFMGLSYLVYEKFASTRWMLFMYLLILTSGYALYSALHHRHWFAKHLMCRALAETLRVKFYLRLASTEPLVDAEDVLSLSGVNSFHGFGWISHVLISLELPSVSVPPGANRGENLYVSWIEDQRKYFTRKVAQLRQNGVRTKRLKSALFGTILAVVLTLLLLGDYAHHQTVIFGESLHTLLTFAMGTAAVMLASWELHLNKTAARELLWQYRNQLKHFTRARLQLASTLGTSRRLEILAQLGKDSLMESYLWTIHRFHREHEPPARA